jgi:hypothetical protein
MHGPYNIKLKNKYASFVMDCVSRGLTLKTLCSGPIVCFCILFEYQEKNCKIISLYSFGLSVFTTETECVYCAVRAKSFLLLFFGSCLGVFEKLRKEIISFFMPVCLSIRPSVYSFRTEQFDSQRTDFYEIWCLRIPRNSVEESQVPLSVIWCFRREVDEKCVLLSYYAASSGNFLPIGCPETSVRNYYYSLRNNPEERISQVSFKCDNRNEYLTWSPMYLCDNITFNQS